MYLKKIHLIARIATRKGFVHCACGWLCKRQANTTWWITTDGSDFYIGDRYGRQIRNRAQGLTLIGMLANA